MEEQIAIIYVGTKNLLKKVPLQKIKEFESDYIACLTMNHKDTMNAFKEGKFSEEYLLVLEKVAKALSERYE